MFRSEKKNDKKLLERIEEQEQKIMRYETRLRGKRKVSGWGPGREKRRQKFSGKFCSEAHPAQSEKFCKCFNDSLSD